MFFNIGTFQCSQTFETSCYSTIICVNHKSYVDDLRVPKRTWSKKTWSLELIGNKISVFSESIRTCCKLAVCMFERPCYLEFRRMKRCLDVLKNERISTFFKSFQYSRFLGKIFVFSAVTCSLFWMQTCICNSALFDVL